MSHIFLSYCAEDRERVRPLVALLSEVAPVWWDQSIHHGENWEIAVETAVEQAACVVVAWTGESVKSNWVRSEAGDARDRSILVPVLLEDVKPPLAFRHIQTAQLQGWTGDPEHPQAQALKAALASIVSRGATSAQSAPVPVPQGATPPPPPSAAQPARRGGGWLVTPGGRVALAAIGAVVLAALVLGGYLMFRPSAGTGSLPAGIGAGNPLPTPSATLVMPTPTAVASPIPKPTVPPPTVSPSPSPPDDRTAQIAFEDIETLGTLDDALRKQHFHYTVDDDGTVYARARWKEEDPLNIGVLRLALFGNLAKRRETRQTAALVALLTTLAHDNDLDLGRVDFKKGDAVSKMDLIDSAKKLLEGWRETGVKPAEAQVHIVASANEPPR